MDKRGRGNGGKGPQGKDAEDKKRSVGRQQQWDANDALAEISSGWKAKKASLDAAKRDEESRKAKDTAQRESGQSQAVQTAAAFLNPGGAGANNNATNAPKM